MRYPAIASLLLLANGCATSPPATGIDHPVSKQQAEVVWARLKSLEGSWRGKSTKGWSDTIQIHTIARGSVVAMSSFDAHPGETMYTMYYPDGDRLLLTHFCAAKNQPRLLLTNASPDGSTATFTFLDATNLPSRDTGHMDKVVLRFTDGGFTERWTWYQRGKESWMEEIGMERIPEPAAPTSRPAS